MIREKVWRCEWTYTERIHQHRKEDHAPDCETHEAIAADPELPFIDLPKAPS